MFLEHRNKPVKASIHNGLTRFCPSLLKSPKNGQGKFESLFLHSINPVKSRFSKNRGQIRGHKFKREWQKPLPFFYMASICLIQAAFSTYSL